LYGALDFNLFLLVIAIIIVVHFCWSWYSSCYTRGLKLDLWHFYIFYSFIFSVFFMYPFAGSFLNDIAMSGKMETIREQVDYAFRINVFGYSSVLLGGYLGNKLLISKSNSFFQKVQNQGAHYLERAIRNKFFIYSLLSFLFSFTAAGLLYSFVRFGVSFKIRNEYLALPEIRPIFNLWVSLFEITLPILIILYLDNKRKLMLVISILILIIFGLFSGNRSTVFFSILNGLLFYLIKNRISLRKLAVLGFTMVLGIFQLGSVRDGRVFEIEELGFLTYSLFYGNNFSDLRDFAYILSYWDGVFLFGKSYLAAFISFIPRHLSAFRNDYAISAYTNNFLGYEDGTHGGIRGGLFFEPFLNFGFAGVFVSGLLLGISLKIANEQIIEQLFEKKDYIKAYSKKFIFIIFSSLMLTANFWQTYVFIFLLIFSTFIPKISFKK
jgi:oligosaccharide repeat unit polymerase